MALVKEGLLALGIILMVLGAVFLVIVAPNVSSASQMAVIFGWIAFIAGALVFVYWCYCQAKAS